MYKSAVCVVHGHGGQLQVEVLQAVTTITLVMYRQTYV